MLSVHDPYGEELRVFSGTYGADIRTGTVRVHRPSGAPAFLVAVVDLCANSQGQAPESLSISWGVGEQSCSAGVRYAAGPVPGVVTRQFVEACEVTAGTRQVSTLDLTEQETTVSAKRFTFRIPLDRIPAASRHGFVPGTVWRQVTVRAASRSAVDGRLGFFVGDIGADASSGYDEGVGGNYVVAGQQ